VDKYTGLFLDRPKYLLSEEDRVLKWVEWGESFESFLTYVTEAIK